jgi:hypothetical protein
MIKQTCWRETFTGIYYLDIPKCASTSLTQALKSIPDTKWEEVPRNSRSISISRSFTVVRNPYDRLVSLYENRVRSSDAPSGIEFRKRYGLSKCSSFEEFLLATLQAESWDPHFELQIAHVHLDSDVYRFETLRGSWKLICAKYFPGKKHPALPHRAKTRRSPWREYYTPALLALVNFAYDVDFIRFGYRKVRGRP